ncbi:hypothetical protein C8F04DRAFT_1261064 [Mycena alexandri]|uniref:Uncharacterized protein n=1 Tax=Mycena alexandri TaxID=1745969 RepID=A0AAD6WK03_9AGAR|nr:hypothetical protein C8F04DRAFT_1353571 [Mycena alexandri]KAJ7019147.1 hypothetical protein C8F04DRAFT_1276615 [Mycena alexandri]KAJ7031466.1 hypothetical protein C8F04DRAFT_1262825 [Mycena alexandri]KAJ7033254.1 hypothetical protein C8F04DRAFT_1261064 [Mycena alexandri]
MRHISAQETRRLHGPRNHPHYKANVRQRAIIRKVAELFTDQQLRIFFGEYHGVRVVMGQSSPTDFGKLQINIARIHSRVTLESDALIPELQQHVRSYLHCYDAYHMKQGNDYAVRDPAAKPGMQAAEQNWHDMVVAYRLERGMGERPEWAVQPLPGLRRVNIALAPAPALIPAPGPAPLLTPVATPRGRRGLAQFPPLPTPPASSPASSPSPASPPSSSPVRSSSPVHVDLSHIDDDDEPARRTLKRKFLGIVEISDDDEEELRPRKKMRYLGHLDLTV